mgnify:CR=1 FL=1
MSHPIYPGNPYPLGVTWDGEGVNFAVYAEWIELCLYNKDGVQTGRHQVRIQEASHHVWHCYTRHPAQATIRVPGRMTEGTTSNLLFSFAV